MWFVPINWASILMKKAYNVGKMKDPKDMLKDVSVFQKLLDLTLRHKKFHIPIVFSHVSRIFLNHFLLKHNISQAVWLAVIGWICILLVGAQNREHHKCLIQASKPTAMKRMKNEAAALQKMKDVAACEYHSFFGYLLLTIPGHEVSNICVVFNKST